MFTIANQLQRTVSRLLANKKRTSSQMANIVGQHKMLANFLNTRQTFVCQHCWQTHVGQHLFVVCPRLKREKLRIISYKPLTKGLKLNQI